MRCPYRILLLKTAKPVNDITTPVGGDSSYPADLSPRIFLLIFCFFVLVPWILPCSSNAWNTFVI